MNKLTGVQTTIDSGELSEKQIEGFKKMLIKGIGYENQKLDMLKEAISHTHERHADQLDQGVAIIEKEIMSRQMDIANSQVSKIIAALQRIETGDFGYCTNCGDDIGAKRLTADPTLENCFTCSDRLERQAKKFR